jgi:hypothetical protein
MVPVHGSSEPLIGCSPANGNQELIRVSNLHALTTRLNETRTGSIFNGSADESGGRFRTSTLSLTSIMSPGKRLEESHECRLERLDHDSVPAVLKLRVLVSILLVFSAWQRSLHVARPPFSKPKAANTSVRKTDGLPRFKTSPYPESALNSSLDGWPNRRATHACRRPRLPRRSRCSFTLPFALPFVLPTPDSRSWEAAERWGGGGLIRARSPCRRPLAL